jgi:hypothetical protein
MATSNLTKHAEDHIPFCKDQGLPDLVAAPKAGVSIQHLATTMPSGGVIDFETYGLKNMANVSYCVIVVNHTDGSATGTVSRAARLKTQITVAGPTAGHELDILVIGQLAGQLG